MDAPVPITEFKGTDLVPTVTATARKETISLANVDQDDLVFPQLLLAQPTSFQKLAAKAGVSVMPGQFVHSNSGAVITPPFRALVVFHNKSRALLPDPDKQEFAGLDRCLSRDGITGSVYGTCATCPHQRWRGDAKQRAKPLCAESAIFTLLTNEGPAMLRVRRSTTINNNMVRNLLTAATFANQDLWEKFLVVGSTQVDGKTPSGKDTTYYTFTLAWQRGVKVSDEMQAAALELHSTVDAHFQAGRFQTEEENGQHEES